MRNQILLILSLLFIAKLSAQRNFSQYHMIGTPQATYVNPAFVPKARFYMSIPGLSYVNAGLSNSAFSFNDLFTTRADDSLEFNTDNVLNKLSDINVLSTQLTQELFALGFKKESSYFNLSVNHRTRFDFLYPGDLIKLLLNGNAQFLNQRASFDNLGVNFSDFMEYNFGYARRIGELFQVGGRIKLISGIANVSTQKSKLGLFTDPTTFALTLDGAAEINTSGFDPLFSDDSTFTTSDLVSNAFNFSNSGVGLDLGGTFQMNDKVLLTFSAVDLGTISWKKYNKNFVLNEINYTFDGVDLTRYFTDSSSNVFKEMGDSLTELFKAEENTNSYRTALGSKFYLGATYEFNPKFSASGLIYSELIKNKVLPGLTLSGNARIKDWLVATVNYTMYNKSFANIGVGLSLRGGPLQFYFMSDNILGLLNTSNTKSIHMCFGTSILLKEKDHKKKGKEKDVISQ